MTERIANEASSTLASPINASTLTLTVASAASFPNSGDFRVRVDDEFLLVTGVSGSTFTVSRGVEGSTAAVHAAGAAVTHVLTAAGLEAYILSVQPVEGGSDVGFVLDGDIASNTNTIGSSGDGDVSGAFLYPNGEVGAYPSDPAINGFGTNLSSDAHERFEIFFNGEMRWDDGAHHYLRTRLELLSEGHLRIRRVVRDPAGTGLPGEEVSTTTGPVVLELTGDGGGVIATSADGSRTLLIGVDALDAKQDKTADRLYVQEAEPTADPAERWQWWELNPDQTLKTLWVNVP